MNLNPAFFDILGFSAFAFIILFAAWVLMYRRLPPRIVIYILLIVGILGLIVDGIIVYQTYLK